MKRILIISCIVLGAVIAAAVIAGFVLLRTAPGHRLIASIVEPRLGAAVGGEADIGALEGRLPGEIIVRDVRLSAADGDWLVVDEIRMRWRPFKAIGKKIDIDNLTIDGVSLLAKPPTKPEDPDAEVSAPFKLPTSFPDVRVAEFALTDLLVDESVAGREIRLAARGDLEMGGSALTANFAADSANDTDTARISISLDPSADRGVIDLRAASTADGLIASLLDLGGPLNVTAAGEAPLSNFSAVLDADVGAYANIDGEIAGNLRDADALRIDTTIVLGERLESLAEELGPELRAAASVARSDEGGLVEIERFESGAGDISGQASWRAPGDELDSFSVDLIANFAEGYRQPLHDYLGDTAKILLTATRSGDTYDLDAAVTAPKADLALKNARSDLKTSLNGDAVLLVKANPALPPPLQNGANAEAAIEFEKDVRAAVSKLVLTLDPQSKITGDGEFAFIDQQVAFDGDVTLSPRLITALAPQVKASAPVSGRIGVDGALDALNATADIKAQALTVNDKKLPPSTASLKMTGFPDQLTADIKGRAQDGSGTLNAAVKRLADTGYVVDPLSLKGRAFTFGGKAMFNPDTQRADLDLAYHGDENAEPWPGLPMAGDFNITGKIGRDADANDLTLAAENLVSEKFSVAALNVHAAGPSSALAIDGDGQGILAPGLGPVDKFEIAALADLGDASTITINSFTGVIRGVDAALTQPAAINFADGIEVDGLRASVGRRGSLAVDARMTPKAWLATIDGQKIPVGDGTSLVTLNIDLDTTKSTIANGKVMARSLLNKGEEASVGASFVWDGDKVRVTNSNPDDPIELDVSIPVKLLREPALGVEVAGELSGEARYDGKVEPLAVYLPETLQSLEGDLKAQARFAGTVENPEITGTMNFADGAYTELVSGLSLTGMRVEATARASTGATEITFEAGARGAGQDTETIKANGSLNMAETSALDTTITLDGAKVSAGPVTSATASGEVTLTGPPDKILAKGEINLDELNAEIVTPAAPGLVGIDVVAVNGSGEEAAEPVPVQQTAPPLILDLAVKADEQLFVRGRGLESEWSADIKATGPAQEPVILGSLNLRRGYLDFSGRRFQVTDGRIAFDKLSPNNPVIDIRAEFETSEGILAAIEIKGRAQSPSIELTSTPSLPSEDIMALVLFGKPATELSALESLQIAQALAQLTGVGPFGGGGGGLTGSARQALGLDMLNVDFDSDTGASSLEVGKYVADGLFVSATQDAKGDSGSVRVEYEVTNSITVETELKQDGDQKVSANWKRDF